MSSDTVLFLKRGQVPVHQNTLCVSADVARGVTRGDLRMTACRSCGFVFNAAFDPAKVSYGPDYENDQTCSVLFNEYVNELAQRLARDVGRQDGTILEVGCGNGYFLKRLLDAGAATRGIGYDPSYRGDASDSRIAFVPRFFSGGENVTADLAICRHVIEHVPDPAAIVAAIRDSLSPSGRVVIETPSIEWILDRVVIWDFFYEHCSLFSVESMTRLLGASGLRVERTEHVFGGQYMLSIARRGDSEGVATRSAADLASRCLSFAASEKGVLGRWCATVAEARAIGGVAVWGAGAKGSTFVNLVDPECRSIACLVDVNPQKQNRFVPGTGHPILSPQALDPREIRTVIVMNPNYETEIRSSLPAGVRVIAESASRAVRVEELR